MSFRFQRNYHSGYSRTQSPDEKKPALAGCWLDVVSVSLEMFVKHGNNPEDDADE